MPVRTIAAVASCILAVSAAGLSAAPSPTIGAGSRTCVLGPGAPCDGVSHPWTAEYHGNLRGASFRHADLRGADLRGADLRRADLRGARLRHADLRGSRLEGARFGVRRARASSSHRVETGVGQASCASYAAGARGADLTGADLSNARIGPGGGMGTNGVTTSFQLADLTGANLSGINGLGGMFECADLDGANLSGARLQGARFNSASMRGADLSGGTFAPEDLIFLRIPTMFLGADLTDATMTGAGFQAPSGLGHNDGGGPVSPFFQGANLTGVDMSNLMLDNAVLIRANLTGVTFAGASLVNASWEGAVFAGTTCPDGSVTDTGC